MRRTLVLPRAALVAPFLLGCQSGSETTEPAPAYRAVFLGAAQDAGMPQLDCARGCCDALREAGESRPVASLAITAPRRWWLVDATPDLPLQIDRMGGLPDGILLTHAHIGHYTGLMYLGRESIDADRVPVHCSARMADYLRSNGPWSQLVALDEIVLRVFESGVPFSLGSGISVTAYEVPHRDEFSDTHAFRFEREGGRSLLYVPDIDRWEDWTPSLDEMADTTDVLVLDGSFYSGAELPGRDMSEIPHPPVVHTMELLQARVDAGDCEVVFSHLNHTNPLWRLESAASRELVRRGYRAASHLLAAATLPYSPL